MQPNKVKRPLILHDQVSAYAKQVVACKIIAGPHVRDACQRHLKDLETAASRGFFFDLDAVNDVIGFFKVVLRLNGQGFEGQPYQLLPWQAFIVGSLFGWKVIETGMRRFTTAYIETAKGSGKSPLAAGVGLYMMVGNKVRIPRAEVYAYATKKDQAMILFRDAVAMVDQSPELAKHLSKSGIGERTYNLAFLKTDRFDHHLN